MRIMLVSLCLMLVAFTNAEIYFQEQFEDGEFFTLDLRGGAHPTPVGRTFMTVCTA